MEFTETVYGRRFFEQQLPVLINALNRIADKQPDSAGDGPLAADGKHDWKNVVYLCFEENSPALYSDAENINHLFLTRDREQVKQWVKLSLGKADENQYQPLFENDAEDFRSDITAERNTKLWMYKDGEESSVLFYGICVYFFDLNQQQDVNAVFT